MFAAQPNARELLGQPGYENLRAETTVSSKRLEWVQKRSEQVGVAQATQEYREHTKEDK